MRTFPGRPAVKKGLFAFIRLKVFLKLWESKNGPGPLSNLMTFMYPELKASKPVHVQ